MLNVSMGLRLYREMYNKSKEDLAKYLEIQPKAYARYESGEREPSYENLSMLACMFDVSIDYLLSDYLEISKERYLKFKKEKKEEEEKQQVFSVRLKELRLQHGLTQKELVELLGAKRNTYSDWENGKCKPNYEKLEKLADLFDVSLDWLFGRDK